MRKSWAQLYAPFLVLVVVQALLIAVAPSRGPQGQNLTALGGPAASGAFAPGDAATTEDGSTDPGAVDAGAVDGTTSAGGTTSSGGGTRSGATAGAKTTVGGAAATTGGAAGGAAGPTPGAAAGGGTAAAAAGGGDTSHCKNGRQVDIGLINNVAPCKAKFTGDNGGATYQGVTKDTIKVIIFQATPNDQVNAILGAKGLATTDAEDTAAYTAYFEFINKNYELYGRKIMWEKVVGDCPSTPPNYDKCNAAAQEVVKKKPALIIWNTSLYASVFDIWAKAGIPSIGGSAFDVNFYTQRRPFRYDVGMDGTQAADHIAEYYCKKMKGGNADHSGKVIHPQVGTRDAVPRKLGIVVPEIEANVATAKEVIAKVKACGGGTSLYFTYASDIERANEQTQSTVENLIANKVTTVTCMCDPIAPVFLTTGMTKNGYFPEFLLPGLGLLDYDLLGQLYDPQQMAHAFGPSHLGQPTTLDESDPAKVWRSTGKSGHPCGNNGCGLGWAFANAAGIAIQAAGPDYGPLTLEQGMLSLPPSGGWEPKKDARQTLYRYGKDDYTGLSDVREVYWDASATTPVDGSKGAYQNVENGRRWELGNWPSNGLAAIPVSPN